MPLSDKVRNYQALKQHVDNLFSAVSTEKWDVVRDLWFDHYAIHKTLGPPKPSEKQDVQHIIQRMSEITALLKQRQDDIALLLRINVPR